MMIVDPKSLRRDQFTLAGVQCEQFWLDVRCEGVIPEQRETIHPDLRASGRAVFRLFGQVTLTLHWQAGFWPDQTDIGLCPENPGFRLTGPIVILDDTQTDELAEQLLRSANTQQAIRSAIHSRMSEIPSVLSGLVMPAGNESST